MREEYVNVNLGNGIKVRFCVKVEEKGNRVVASTDRRAEYVVLQYFQRKTKNTFSIIYFNESIQKRLLLRPKYKVVIEYGFSEMPDAEHAKEFAIACLKKKLQGYIRRRIDYISNILMDIHNSLQ